MHLIKSDFTTQLNTIDLFSGCGGLTLGFSWAGFKSILASDIDENCEATFTSNFKGTPFLKGDLSDFTKEEFDKIIKDKNVDVILGGRLAKGSVLPTKTGTRFRKTPATSCFINL